jgi:hypothetical protein
MFRCNTIAPISATKLHMCKELGCYFWLIGLIATTDVAAWYPAPGANRSSALLDKVPVELVFSTRANKLDHSRFQRLSSAAARSMPCHPLAEPREIVFPTVHLIVDFLPRGRSFSRVCFDVLSREQTTRGTVALFLLVIRSRDDEI